MLSLNTLPADILLQIVASLNLRDAVSLSMASKTLSLLSHEHSYWLKPLLSTSPLPCSPTADLAARPALALKQLVLHALRLQRNWSKPRPQVAGPMRTFQCGAHISILHCVPGTDTLVLYAPTLGTIIGPLEESGGCTLAMLVDDDGVMRIVVLRVTVDPVGMVRVFSHELEHGYTNSCVFLTTVVVGVVRALRGGTVVEVQSFNLADPALSTLIVTDRPYSPANVIGCAVIGSTVFLITLQFPDAFVYACPPRLLPVAPAPDYTDYTLRRSHVARLPWPELRLARPSLPRIDHAVFSTEPQHGHATVSVAHVMHGVNGGHVSCAVEVTFWTRPPGRMAEFTSNVGAASAVNRKGNEGQRAFEAEARLLRPAHTLAIPGPMYGNLLAVASSGLAVVCAVNPAPATAAADDDAGEGSDNPGGGDNIHSVEGVDDDEDEHDDGNLQTPKLMLARYDPALDAVSLHELRLPAFTNSTIGLVEDLEEESEGDPELDMWCIQALAVDDHRGVVVVVLGISDTKGMVCCIPYA
ncbi:hypothetical protein B0H19DRAFT_1270159 [Mycena capillaripes]|nr:hypothetical protein B0H19DRAFT_1270159 [Mycena capillaripes]